MYLRKCPCSYNKGYCFESLWWFIILYPNSEIRCRRFICSFTNKHEFEQVCFYLVILLHCIGVIISVMVSQITSVSIVYSTVCSGANQRKHQSSASLALVREIHWWPANSPHKRPVTRKIFPLNDVIIYLEEQALCYWDRVYSKVCKHHPSVVCFMVYVGHSNDEHVLSKTYLTGSKTRQS